jgi:hypothetical protein
MAAIFDDTSFAGVQPRDAYGTDGAIIPIQHPDHAVQLLLSDRTLVTVFSSVTVALRCMEFMHLREQWLLQASDDIIIVSCGAKLILAEASLVNQKLLASFMPVYFGGQTRFAHRSMSSLLRLSDALQTVGYCVQSPLLNNYDLANAIGPPHLLLVDVKFTNTPTNDNPGSKLDDGAYQLIYRYT